MRLGCHILYEVGDERDGLWTREQLLEMDARFTERLEEAFRLGLESRESAAGQVKLPVSPVPRRMPPLPREIQEGPWTAPPSKYPTCPILPEERAARVCGICA